jgi:hypothetical protein
MRWRWQLNGKGSPSFIGRAGSRPGLRMPRWRVDIIRKRVEHLGTVEAANANEAKKIAAKEFDIPPERQNRIAVEKVSKSKD